MSDSDRAAGGRKRGVPSATPASAGYRPIKSLPALLMLALSGSLLCLALA